MLLLPSRAFSTGQGSCNFLVLGTHLGSTVHDEKSSEVRTLDGSSLLLNHLCNLKARGHIPSCCIAEKLVLQPKPCRNTWGGQAFPNLFWEEESINYQPVYREHELELMEGNADNDILRVHSFLWLLSQNLQCCSGRAQGLKEEMSLKLYGVQSQTWGGSDNLGASS